MADSSPTAAPIATPRSSERLVELDALRGLAAVSVVLMHYTVSFDRLFHHQDPLWMRNPLGGYGVELFFMLSGFVILMSLDRVQTTLDFVVSRFARLYPVYWVAILMTFGIVSLCGLPTKAVGIQDAVVDLTMLQGLFGFRHVDEVYWTLQCELQFYVLMGLVFALGWRRQVMGLMAGLVSLALINTHVGFTEWTGAGLWRLNHYLPFGELYLFLAGIVFYESRSGWTRTHAAALLLCVASIVHREPQHIALVCGCGGLVLAASRGRMPWLRHPRLTFLGAISYSLYLIHQNVGYVIIRAGYQFGWNGNVSIIVAAAVSLLLACGLTFAIERPCNRILRDRYRAWTTRTRIQEPSLVLEGHRT